MNGNKRHRAVTVQARIKLVEQVHLKTLRHQTFFHKVGDLKVYGCLCQVHLTLPLCPATMPMRNCGKGVTIAFGAA